MHAAMRPKSLVVDLADSFSMFQLITRNGVAAALASDLAILAVLLASGGWTSDFLSGDCGSGADGAPADGALDDGALCGGALEPAM
jgi:hypothetical protein